MRRLDYESQKHAESDQRPGNARNFPDARANTDD